MPDSMIVDELLRIVRFAEPEPTTDELAAEKMRLRMVQEREQELAQVAKANQVQNADTGDLESMLKNTGRANATENAEGVLGGKRDKLADERAEASAGKVLQGMENATRLNQKVENSFKDKDAPLSHAVSGHGKDTDQVSRLVNGRRNDQLNTEARDLKEVQQLIQEREDELVRRNTAINNKDAQLSLQSTRLDAGKPSNVSQQSWDEEKRRFKNEKEINKKARETWVKDSEKWNKEQKPKLQKQELEFDTALKKAQSNPASYIDLPVPAGIDGHIPMQSTVGDDPSNVSGAFSTNQGMLHAVQEGFAQANMVSSYDDQQERNQATSSSGRFDGERFVTNVSGRGDEELGYNLSVEGVHEQRAKKGDKTVGLAKDEMEERAKLIKKTGDLKNARIVLDPAYVDGKRAGWNLQTAYANSDAPTKSFDNPQSLVGSLKEAERNRVTLEKKMKECESTTVEKRKDKSQAESKLAETQNDIDYYTQEQNKIPADPQDRKPKDLENDLKKSVKSYELLWDKIRENLPTGPVTFDQQNQLDTAQAEVQRLKDLIVRAECVNKLRGLVNILKRDQASLLTATQALDQAVQKENQVKADLEIAQKEEQKLRPPVDSNSVATDAKSDPEEKQGSGTAGYDPVSGLWEGDRPTKPSGSLKGTDENGKPLTAHHLLPWNQIRDALNAALKGKSATKLQEFLDFAEVTVAPWFWTELGKAPADRNYRFSEEVNRIGKDICWAPKNVFMGPLGETRGDDPGEELDTAFVSGGLPTMQSVSSVLTGQTGGIGATPSEFNKENKDRIEAKYSKEVKKGDPKAIEAMKREMVEAGVWEYVREDFPNVIAKRRMKEQLQTAYEDLVKKYIQKEGVTKAEELSNETVEELYEELKKLEESAVPPKLKLTDLKPNELQELEQRMLGLGEGYESAKAAFLKDQGVTSDTELSDKQREQLQNHLFQFKNPKQRLAETMTERAKQPFGADEASASEPRAYKEEEWEVVNGKKVRRKLVKAPPELQEMMSKVDEAIDMEVVSQTPVLKPSKINPKMPPLPQPQLLKSDYQVVIDKLETVKKEWETRLEEFRNVPRPPPLKPGEEVSSNKEILTHFPPALQASDRIDQRLEQLRKLQAKIK